MVANWSTGATWAGTLFLLIQPRRPPPNRSGSRRCRVTRRVG